MGTRNWHLARATRHAEVAQHLHDADYDDWAAVALFYAGHQWVHSVLSGEPELRKDERHPRKHTMPPGAGSGGRGTNQLVNALFPDGPAEAYASLFEMGRRTRYEHHQLEGHAYRLLMLQFGTLVDHCRLVNASRADRPTQEP